MQDFEQLGSFYLGREYDLAAKRGDPTSLVLYDSKDLVTHAVCVGMTGSGKTGLCLTLLEEAAIDGIPAIVIDPKGDLSNLLLTFPDLAPADFEPWVNAQDAAKRGLSAAQFAEQQAALWREGLAAWGQDGARIQKLRQAADFRIYTPGSNAGVGVSILESLRAPGAELIEDSELYRERIASTATSLLCLLGIDADPIQSREHILLSTLFARAWSAGEDLDLGLLIRQIQEPPVARVGVLDLESFYPAKERFALAMRLNNLLAAPGFAAWMEGEPLDIDAILHTPAGKPRVAIFSIAHLSDPERMFFVSLLLNQMLAWTRAQAGTSSLRALLYMDEIAGYFPPTAEPPSKRPLLLLMKQARAFGVGVVLATQNPVDLDYKGLSNAGTWFIGRLQTERDKARVLDGLEGAAATSAAGFDRQAVDSMLSQLTNRVFYVNNVHEDRPRILEVRWAMSYLRGPLTRAEIKRLGEAGGRTAPPTAKGPVVCAPPGASAAGSPPAGSTAAPVAAPGVPAAQAAPTTAASAAVSTSGGTPPVLPPSIQQVFLPVSGGLQQGWTLVYAPMLFGSAKLYFADKKLGVEQELALHTLTPLSSGLVAVDFEASEEVELDLEDVESTPRPAARFDVLAAEACKAKSYDAWRKQFVDSAYRTSKLVLHRCQSLDEVSKPGENEREFRLRLLQIARERRDARAEKLRQKYSSRFVTLDERIRRAEQAHDVQKEQARDAKLSGALSLGGAILGAFFGSKRSVVGKASTAARGASRSARESSDVERAAETVEALRRQRADLEAEAQAELASADPRVDPASEPLEPVEVGLKKTNVTVRAFALAWVPLWQAPDGSRTPAWK
ncbi:MAG: ATP-binding protein [Planctomycetes bacterium]|nr:ATP-binding protein [Planctomycetota bacterium]